MSSSVALVVCEPARVQAAPFGVNIIGEFEMMKAALTAVLALGAGFYFTQVWQEMSCQKRQHVRLTRLVGTCSPAFWTSKTSILLA